jgi:hypothetical protein
MKLLIAVIASAALVIGSWGIAHAEERHLFYVHGCCIKNKDDPKVKAYETMFRN